MTFEYTQKITKDLVETYLAAEQAEGTYEARQAAVEELADRYGLKVAQVRAKLVTEGVYIAKAKEATKGRVVKADLVGAIAKQLDLTEEELDTFEKATKQALVKVLGRVTALREAAKAIQA